VGRVEVHDALEVVGPAEGRREVVGGRAVVTDGQLVVGELGGGVVRDLRELLW
jgi:hypothetical protein